MSQPAQGDDPHVRILPAKVVVKKGTPSPRKGTGREWVGILIRLTKKDAQHIRDVAKANFRSRAAECRFRLEASMANESIDEHGVIVVRSTVPLK